jgi:DNA recombination protein RmuC
LFGIRIKYKYSGDVLNKLIVGETIDGGCKMYESYVISAILFSLVIYLILKYKKSERKISEIGAKMDELNNNMSTLIDGAVAKSLQNSAKIFESLFSSAIAKNTDVIKGAFATSLKELGIQEDIGRMREASEDLKTITSDLKTMFQVKHARARFGELQLEYLLKDIFPHTRVSFQKNIGIGIPDACILVENNKYLCIDSKFPLENFKKYCQSDNEKERFWKDFVQDVKKHIENVKKYVGRDNTLDFAFMFVPSDTIFYHLVSEAPELAVEAGKQGVILTSPSVLPAYLSLISARITAEEISKRTEEIQKKLDGIGRYIGTLGSTLEVLSTHINNTSKNLPKVRQSFDDLKRYYTALCSLEGIDEEDDR